MHDGVEPGIVVQGDTSSGIISLDMTSVEKKLCISTARIDLRSTGRELTEWVDGLTAAAIPPTDTPPST